MSKRQHSLRRKCFGRLNLLEEFDSCSASVDQASYHTPVDNTVLAPATAHITIEDTDSGSKQPKRRHGSVTPNVLPSPLQSKKSLRHSTSGSSIDSGVGLSRASSLSSLPYGSKRPSRESSSTVDTASPLLASQKSVNERLSINDSCGSPCPYNNSIIASEPTNLEILNEDSIIDGEVDDLSQRALRLSISRGVVEDLQTAVQRLLDDMQQQPPAGQVHRQRHLNVDVRSSVESDGPSFPKRRHSSADPYMPLTQRLSRQVERKRSAQPFFHQSTEDSSNTTRRRKPSGCIVCERKHREPTMSADSVFIKTARFPEQQKRRRYSEVLKVCKPSDIPYTEVRLMTFEEYRQRDTPNHQRLPRRHAWTLPHTLPSQLRRPDVVRDEQLQFVLESNLPQFLECTDWNILFGHLVSKHLLTTESREILLCSLRTSIDKGNHFYGRVLPKMGHESEAYIKLYQCLEESRIEHLGHDTLLDILDSGLQSYYYDKYCHNKAKHFQEPN